MENGDSLQLFLLFVGLLFSHPYCVYFLSCLLILFLGRVDISLRLICKHLNLWHCPSAVWVHLQDSTTYQPGRTRRMVFFSNLGRIHKDLQEQWEPVGRGHSKCWGLKKGCVCQHLQVMGGHRDPMSLSSQQNKPCSGLSVLILVLCIGNIPVCSFLFYLSAFCYECHSMETFTRYQLLGLRNGGLNEPIINFPPRYYYVTLAGNGSRWVLETWIQE